jgi:hypothetical protein
MRIVAEIPHPQMKISIMIWNEKYLIKMECGQFEQYYKIKKEDIGSIEDVQKLIDAEFQQKVLEQFSVMSKNFLNAWKKAT